MDHSSSCRASDFASFIQLVDEKTGIDLSQYRSEQMVRRLWVLVERAGDPSFTQYFRRIVRDESEWGRFLDRLTINVSELYRNPERWDDLQRQYLPQLAQRSGLVRAWSAGCSIGAEPYTMAMVGLESPTVARVEIVATDLDQNILRRAQEAMYRSDEVRSIPQDVLKRYCEPCGEMWTVKPEVRECVSFRRHNLLEDPPPGEFDLIVCRNVVIYFTEAAKVGVYDRMMKGLRPGGVLFAGGAERVVQPERHGLRSVSDGFYLKAA